MISNIKKLENIIRINFQNKKLLKQSLIHKSFDENYNNEKLEFLGDRVIGLVISVFVILNTDIIITSLINSLILIYIDKAEHEFIG